MIGKIIEFIVGVALVALVVGLGVAVTRWTFSIVFSGHDSVPSQEAIDNTERRAYEAIFRKDFVRGCTQEGLTESECQCGLRGLENMYPDFMYNEARLERIVTDGYNEREVDMIVDCFEVVNYRMEST